MGQDGKVRKVPSTGKEVRHHVERTREVGDLLAVSVKALVVGGDAA